MGTGRSVPEPGDNVYLPETGLSDRLMAPVGQLMRSASFLGLVALAAAIGALCVGRLVVLPGLGQHPELVDANFAKALAEPLHLRLAEVVLAAHLIVAAVARPWLGTRAGTTIGLVLVGCSAAHRMLVLPALYSAWSKADLVAARPVDHILAAQRFELVELVMVATMATLHLALIGTHVVRSHQPPAAATPNPKQPVPTPVPSAA